MPVPVDATKGWARCTSASDWTALLASTGASNPDDSYDCTEGSGNLIDDIGATNLTAQNSPLYGQSATGWAGTGVAVTNASTGRFVMPSGTGPNPTTTSQVWLWTIHTGSVPGANSAISGINSSTGTNAYRFLMLTSGRLRAVFNGVSVDSASTAYANTDLVVVMRYDRAAGVAKLYINNAETLTNVYSSSAIVDGVKGFGSSAGIGGIVCMQMALWTGANAESLDDTKIAAIISAIKSPPSGSSTGHYYRRLRQMAMQGA